MSSEYIGIEDARKRLGPLVTAAQQGADIVLTRNGKPAARIVPVEVTMYTVEIQASNPDRTIWQALHPAETVESIDPAAEVAADVAQNQNIAEGDDWRVVVWEGADADTGAEPAYTYYPPTVTLPDLTTRLGLPDHEQSAVLAWTGEAPGHAWTEAEADELADAWAADTERIATEG